MQTANSLGLGRKNIQSVVVRYQKGSNVQAIKKALFNVDTDSQIYTRHKTLGPLQMAQPFTDGNYPSPTNLTPQFDVQLTPVEYGTRWDISYQAQQTDQYGIFTNPAERLMSAQDSRREFYIALFYGGGFTSTTSTGDGNPLFYATHTSNGGSNYSSLDTAQTLSYTALESGYVATTQQRDPSGRRFAAPNGLMLVTGNTLAVRADRIVNTDGIAGSNDRDKNVMQGKLTPMVLTYLDDFTTTGYFFVNKDSNSRSVYWQDQFSDVFNLWTGPFKEIAVTNQCSYGAVAVDAYGLMGNAGA